MSLQRKKKQLRKTKNFTYLFERYVAVSIACMNEVDKHFTMSDVLAIFCGVTPKEKPLPTLHFLYGDGWRDTLILWNYLKQEWLSQVE